MQNGNGAIHWSDLRLDTPPSPRREDDEATSLMEQAKYLRQQSAKLDALAYRLEGRWYELKGDPDQAEFYRGLADGDRTAYVRLRAKQYRRDGKIDPGDEERRADILAYAATLPPAEPHPCNAEKCPDAEAPCSECDHTIVYATNGAAK